MLAAAKVTTATGRGGGIFFSFFFLFYFPLFGAGGGGGGGREAGRGGGRGGGEGGGQGERGGAGGRLLRHHLLRLRDGGRECRVAGGGVAD